MRAGRPTDYSDELADRICIFIEKGLTVSEITAKTDMPSHDTFYRWRREKPEFSDKVTHAREERLEADRDQLRSLARLVLEDPTVDHNRVNSAVNAIDKAARLTAPKTTKVHLSGGVNIEKITREVVKPDAS